MLRQDLEADLDGIRPGCCVPALLGKLLNTLANDRNVKYVTLLLIIPCNPRSKRSSSHEYRTLTNFFSPRASSTNWIAALRRQYARRFVGINPFYEDVKVPVVNGEPVLGAPKEEKPVEEVAAKAEDGEEPKKEDGVASTSILPTPTTDNSALPLAAEAADEVKMDVDPVEKKGEEGEVEYTWVLKEVGWEDVDLETKVRLLAPPYRVYN